MAGRPYLRGPRSVTAPIELQALVALYLMVPVLGTLAVACVTAYAMENGWMERGWSDRRRMAVRK